MTDAVIGGGGLGAVSRPRGLLRALWLQPAEEGERRFLCLPVFCGAGIGAYFSLKFEPPLWPAVAVALTGLALVVLLRRQGGWCEGALVFTTFAAGFGLMRKTPWHRGWRMLQRQLGPVALTGRLIDIDLVEKSLRII